MEFGEAIRTADPTIQVGAIGFEESGDPNNLGWWNYNNCLKRNQDHLRIISSVPRGPHTPRMRLKARVQGSSLTVGVCAQVGTRDRALSPHPRVDSDFPCEEGPSKRDEQMRCRRWRRRRT